MKSCKKCGEAKSNSEFSAAKRMRDGLRSHCKTCQSIYNAVWQKEHPEKSRAANLARYAANAAKEKAYAATYRALHPEKVKVATAAWRKANQKKITDYRAANAVRDAAYHAAYRSANPEAGRIHWQNYQASKLASGGKLTKGLAVKLFKLQRGMCPCCKMPLGDDFHLDHRMPLALGGSNTDDNMQLLRSTCNQQKHAKHPVDFMRSRGFLL